MCRQLKKIIPIFGTLKDSQDTQDIQDMAFRARDAEIKQRQKKYFDLRHRVKQLPPVKEGQEVWIKLIMINRSYGFSKVGSSSYLSNRVPN